MSTVANYSFPDEVWTKVFGYLHYDVLNVLEEVIPITSKLRQPFNARFYQLVSLKPYPCNKRLRPVIANAPAAFSIQYAQFLASPDKVNALVKGIELAGDVPDPDFPETNEDGKELTVWDQIVKLEGPNRFEHIEYLALYSCPINSLAGLRKFPKLKTLVMGELLQITNLEELGQFGSIESLTLLYANISVLEGLGQLQKLQKLVLTNVPVTKLEGLDELKSLKKALSSPVCK